MTVMMEDSTVVVYVTRLKDDIYCTIHSLLHNMVGRNVVTFYNLINEKTFLFETTDPFATLAFSKNFPHYYNRTTEMPQRYSARVPSV